ncbi:hypothetical protein SAMN05444287_2760 [Octadecabacter temperatus]|uniref:Uncharacterized protein n=1 Tax=Octadecabacter temperatus TaxID=1458307 RepID=A0A0K0Y9K0_9RHOB|nr:hypothetical protein [Octadecabacter temperatus]AKS47586.1 hypothetical protein OSB_30700 [Octadecabacter temperatus]SIO40947.1 hypothetical protein SAMN05444287_2760 [Octadecabacter temperatus]
MTYRLATSFIALSTALAAPALADVNAADVWSNQQALYAGMGATLSGEISGDQLVNPEINVILPEGIASFQIKTDAVSMIENSDGSVTIEYPSPMTLTVAGGAQGEGSFSATATMTHDGYTVTASGNPGDVAYVSEGNNLRFEIGDVSVDGATGLEKIAIEGFMTLANWGGTSQVTEGNLITYTADTEIGASEADFTFSVDNITSRSQQITQPMTSSIDATFQVGGSDVMNLSEALRNGLSVVARSTGEGNSSSTETTLDGDVINTQKTSTGAQEFALSFTEEGLAMNGEANAFAMTMFEPLLFPGELDLGIGALSMDYDVPLNASDEPQDFRIATGLKDVTVGDSIWGMIDPTGQLPRDPAEISFDVTGVGTNGMDLLDIAAMVGLMGPPPIEIDEVTIENLRIAAVGAEATATGAMTFDWTDFQTIPGIARPEGTVTVNLTGANALMDKLVAMGIIPEEELMMPRMMMGMFATPVGDDMLESVLEVNSEGHVLANGQRLQ